MTASGVGDVKGWWIEQKEKGLMDMENIMVIMREEGY